MTLGVEREGLAEPLRELARAGSAGARRPAPGMIMLDREHLGLMDMRAERNAFGRQVRSFEADVALEGFAAGRSTRSSSARPGSPSTVRMSSILGSVDGHAVAVAAGRITAVAFHPELDRRRSAPPPAARAGVILPRC